MMKKKMIFFDSARQLGKENIFIVIIIVKKFCLLIGSLIYVSQPEAKLAYDYNNDE